MPSLKSTFEEATKQVEIHREIDSILGGLEAEPLAILLGLAQLIATAKIISCNVSHPPIETYSPTQGMRAFTPGPISRVEMTITHRTEVSHARP